MKNCTPCGFKSNNNAWYTCLGCCYESPDYDWLCNCLTSNYISKESGNQYMVTCNAICCCSYIAPSYKGIEGLSESENQFVVSNKYRRSNDWIVCGFMGCPFFSNIIDCDAVIEMEPTSCIPSNQYERCCCELVCWWLVCVPCYFSCVWPCLKTVQYYLQPLAPDTTTKTNTEIKCEYEQHYKNEINIVVYDMLYKTGNEPQLQKMITEYL
jgi:hypothetical protein